MPAGMETDPRESANCALMFGNLASYATPHRFAARSPMPPCEQSRSCTLRSYKVTSRRSIGCWRPIYRSICSRLMVWARHALGARNTEPDDDATVDRTGLPGRRTGERRHDDSDARGIVGVFGKGQVSARPRCQRRCVRQPRASPRCIVLPKEVTSMCSLSCSSMGSCPISKLWDTRRTIAEKMGHQEIVEAAQPRNR